MHKKLLKFYCFIDKLIIEDVKKLNSKIAIIYRNYETKPKNSEIIRFKNYCKLTNRKFFISNYIDLAVKFKLNGLYIPSFNKKFISKNLKTIPNFEIIGSAHNLKEIKIKENQNVSQIFLSSIFKVKKKSNYLGVCKFNNLSRVTKIPIIALGGINNNNIKSLQMTNAFGLAGISHFKCKE